MLLLSISLSITHQGPNVFLAELVRLLRQLSRLIGLSRFSGLQRSPQSGQQGSAPEATVFLQAIYVSLQEVWVLQSCTAS